ncbi:MAG: glycan-binding surface protein, partial [Bacteroidota bacterium]
LTDSLTNVNEVTAFAPTNSAFDAFFAEADNFASLSDFDTSEELAVLKNLLKYHLFPGTLPGNQMFDGNTVSTAFGTDLTIGLTAGLPSLTPSYVDAIPSKVTASYEDADNGIIHEIDRVLIATELSDALGIGGEVVVHPVVNSGLVFFDWDDGNKGHWWGGAVSENQSAISLNGNYGRVNMSTGGTAWVDLFWRNGGTMNGADVVGSSLSSYSLKFDINILEPISAGQFTFRFNNSNSGTDAYYAWAPWNATGEPYSTDGWVTIEIPLTDIGQPDFTGLDMEFGAAFQNADVTLNFAIDNIRFDAPGVPD